MIYKEVLRNKIEKQINNIKYYINENILYIKLLDNNDKEYLIKFQLSEKSKEYIILKNGVFSLKNSFQIKIIKNIFNLEKLSKTSQLKLIKMEESEKCENKINDYIAIVLTIPETFFNIPLFLIEDKKENNKLCIDELSKSKEIKKLQEIFTKIFLILTNHQKQDLSIKMNKIEFEKLLNI
jgi:uncharacterized protein YrzB (UPF0473 family)